MGSRFRNYIVISMVAGIVSTVGSFQCKGAEESNMVMIQHPGCTMIEPHGNMSNLQAVASAVDLKPGNNHFEFDCEGKQVEADYEAKGGEHWLSFDPENGFSMGSVKKLPEKVEIPDIY